MAGATTSPEFAVAVSFLYRDEPLASEIHDRLLGNLSVFVFSRRDEQVIGKDGYEQYSRLFRRDSRLVVVLHREGWGNSPFTSVEEHAIKSRHFDGAYSWDHLLAVRCDSTPIPDWIPPYRIYFRLDDDDSSDALITHIANLAVEKGARVTPRSARDEINRRQLERQHEAQLDSFFWSTEGRNLVQQQVIGLFESLAGELPHLRGVSARVEFEGARGRLHFEDVALTLWLLPPDQQHARPKLEVVAYDGPFPTNLRGGRILDVRDPRQLTTRIFRLTQDVAGRYHWVPDGSKSKLSPAQLVEEILLEAMKAADRRRR